MGNDAFTLAQTGLIAQMKLSCLIVFGEGRSNSEIAVRCLSNKKIRVTLNVMALLSERGGRRRRGWVTEMKTGF